MHTIETNGILKTLVIVGAGGHGRVIADAAHCCGTWDNICFYDDNEKGVLGELKWPILGTLNDYLTSTAKSDTRFIVGIGNNRLRLRIAAKLASQGHRSTTVVHPRATVSPFCKISEGCVVMAGAVINIGATIGATTIINTNSTVEHDCHIGKGAHISPGAQLAGEVTVEECSWIGTGAVVINQVTTGTDSIIGAGSVVLRHVRPGEVVVGNPAVKLEKKIFSIKSKVQGATA